MQQAMQALSLTDSVLAWLTGLLLYTPFIVLHYHVLAWCTHGNTHIVHGNTMYRACLTMCAPR